MSNSEFTHLTVTPELAIPRTELEFHASRAGGAGGQHVNTSSTRIQLHWDMLRSSALSPEMRQRLTAKLRTRINANGVLRVVASERRSQTQNRLAAEQRLADLVRRALVVPKKRRATKPTRASKERRLTEKKRRSDRKKNRRPDISD